MTQYQSNPAFLANSLNYTPQQGMAQTLGNMLLSQAGFNVNPTPMPGMSQYDLNTILANTQRRQMMEQQYKGFNPTAIYAASSVLGGMGVQNPMSYFIGPGGNVNSAGKIISSVFNDFAGGYASPWSQMGRHQNMIMDSLRGTVVGNSSFMRGSLGIGSGQAGQIYSQLMRGTYSDTKMTQRRGPFDAAQMMDIFRMGADRDIFRNAGMGSIGLRTQNLARLVETSRNTFNIADPSEALDAVTEITGGSIPITQTTKLQDTLQKVKSLARTANISMDVLKQIVARGAEVAKQLDMTGMTGTQLTTSSLQNLKLVQSIPGAVSDTTIARAGGQRNAERVYSELQQQFLASDKMREVSGIVGAFRNLGLDTSGIMDQVRSGGRFTGGQFSQAFDSVVNAQAAIIRKSMPNLSQSQVMQMARQQARLSIQQGTATGQEIIATEGGGMMNQMTNEILNDVFFNTSTRDSSGNRVASPYRDIVNRLRAGGKVSQDEINLLKTQFQNAAVTNFMGQGKSRAESVLAGETLFGQLVNSQEIQDRSKKLKANQARATINENYLERTRVRGTAIERMLTAVGAGGNTTGDILAAALPQGVDEFGIATGSEEAMINAIVNSEDMVKTFMSTSRGMDVFRSLHNMTGKAITSKKDARNLMKIMRGDMDLSGISLSEEEKNRFRNRVGKSLKDGNLVTLAETLGGAEMNKANIMKAMKFLQEEKEGEASFNRIMSDRSTFIESKLGMGDLERITLTKSDVEAFNSGATNLGSAKMKALNRLKEMSGLDKLDAAQLQKLAETDPELAKEIEYLTMTDDQLNQKVREKLGGMIDKGKEIYRFSRDRVQKFTRGVANRTLFGGSVADMEKGSTALGMDYFNRFFGESLVTDKEGNTTFNLDTLESLYEDMRLHGPEHAIASMIARNADKNPEMAIKSDAMFGDIMAASKKLFGDKFLERIKLPQKVFQTMFKAKDSEQRNMIREQISSKILGDMTVTQQAELIASEELKGKKGKALTTAMKNIIGKNKITLPEGVSEDEAYQEMLVMAQENVSKGLSKKGAVVDALTGLVKEIKDYNPMIHDALQELNNNITTVMKGDRLKVDVK